MASSSVFNLLLFISSIADVDAILPAGQGTLQNVHTGNCVNLATCGDCPSIGCPPQYDLTVEAYACTGQLNEVFEFFPDGTIRNPNCGDCLVVTDNTSGTLLNLADCFDSHTGKLRDGSVWSFDETAGTIKQQSGLCMHDNGIGKYRVSQQGCYNSITGDIDPENMWKWSTIQAGIDGQNINV